MGNFDDLIKWFPGYYSFANLCKLVRHVIITPVSYDPLNLEKEKNYKNWISREQKELFAWSSIFILVKYKKIVDASSETIQRFEEVISTLLTIEIDEYNNTKF